MNKNKRLGRKAMMAAAMIGSLTANGVPVAAKEMRPISDKAYYADMFNKSPALKNQTRALEPVTIDLQTVGGAGDHSDLGYRVVQDSTNSSVLVIELTEAGRSYTIKGSNVVSEISKYRIAAKADIQLTLEDASITFDDGVVRSCDNSNVPGRNVKRGSSPLLIDYNKKVELILKGENILRCGAYGCGIVLEKNSELTFSKESTGVLKTFGRDRLETDKEVNRNGYDYLGNQATGIGELPGMKKTIEENFNGKWTSEYPDSLSSHVRLEGGRVEIKNVKYGIASKTLSYFDGGGTLQIENDGKEESADLYKSVKIKNFEFDAGEITEHILLIPGQKRKKISLLDAQDEYILRHKDLLNNKETNEQGQISIPWPKETIGMIYLLVNGQAYWGEVKEGVSYLDPMKNIQGTILIHREGDFLTEESTTPASAKVLRYQWYVSDSENRGYQPISGAKGDQCALLKDHTVRYYKVEAEYFDKEKGEYGTLLSKPFKTVWEEEKKTEPPKPAKKPAPISKNRQEIQSVKLSWKKKKGVSGYRIYRSIQGQKYKKIKTVKGNKNSLKTTLNTKYKYRFRVKPYRKKKVYANRSVKKKILKRTITYTFKNVPKNKYYKLQLKKGKSGKAYKKAGYKTVKKVKTANGTVSYKLSGKSGYSYDVRLVQQ